MGPPPPLLVPRPEYERVFPPATVCAVTTAGGSGLGILCTLKNALCVLTPCHVLCPETLTKISSRVVALRVDGPDSKTVTLNLRPDVFFAHSPAPQDGRPPDVNRMDYALVACELVGDLWGASAKNSESSASASASGSACDKKTKTNLHFFARPLEDARQGHFVECGDAIHVGVSAGHLDETRETESDETKEKEKENDVSVSWRRGFVTAAPRLFGTFNSQKKTTNVSLRYDARTVPGESGAAVCSVPKLGLGELPSELVQRKRDSNNTRGTGTLLAMHRAGADGEDGEGVLVSEIFKDVRETLATRKLRHAASKGNTGVAVLELNRTPGTSRGHRSRAAAAAAEVVAAQPAMAVAAMACVADKGGYVSVGAARAASACEALETNMCAWAAFDPKSSRLAAGIAHALGALARAGIVPSGGGLEGDACVVATLEAHYANQAVREKAEWALRLRRARGLR